MLPDSSAASELRKCSVPLAAVSAEPFGIAGQTVKPGSAFVTARFSRCWNGTLAAPLVSCFVENAYSCAAMNSGPISSYSLVVM